MKNLTNRQLLNYAILVCCLLIQTAFSGLNAQEEKTATITLTFEKTDSTKTCIAMVKSDTTPVANTEVHLYVKGLFSLLEIGKPVVTDESGVAIIEFPTNLPGNEKGKIVLIAKIENDENYGSAEVQAEVDWGAALKTESIHWNDRSLSASRERAPMMLVIASTAIILLIWGTIFYVVYQLVRIKNAYKVVKTAE